MVGTRANAMLGDDRPFSTKRTHNPAMQPAAAQVGRQKWARAQARHNAARQFEHQPNRSVNLTPHDAHTSWLSSVGGSG